MISNDTEVIQANTSPYTRVPPSGEQTYTQNKVGSVGSECLHATLVPESRPRWWCVFHFVHCVNSPFRSLPRGYIQNSSCLVILNNFFPKSTKFIGIARQQLLLTRCEATAAQARKHSTQRRLSLCSSRHRWGADQGLEGPAGPGEDTPAWPGEAANSHPDARKQVGSKNRTNPSSLPKPRHLLDEAACS